MEYKTPYTFTPELGEVNDMPSLTIQGDAYTIEELMLKFSTGQLPQVKREPQFSNPSSFDDPDYNSLQGIDLVDRDDELRSVRERSITYKQLIEADMKAQNEKLIEQKAKDLLFEQQQEKQKTESKLPKGSTDSV